MTGGHDPLSVLGPIAAFLAIGLYLWAAARCRSRGQDWPRHRQQLWLLGVLLATAAVAGPLAAAAHSSFTAHMGGHLLLAMLAPLLLVLAAPATLALRILPVRAARRLSRVLSSWPVRVATEPVVAAVLSVGGLWLLYTTDLYEAMHRQPLLHLMVHVHLFVAGYLFTVAMVSVDPLPHRRGFMHRAVVLVAALAAHDILAKYLYAHPPQGVGEVAARTGAMTMYYGGDAVEILLIVLLCHRWYRAAQRSRPQRKPHRLSRSHLNHSSTQGATVSASTPAQGARP